MIWRASEYVSATWQCIDVHADLWSGPEVVEFENSDNYMI